MNLEGFDDAAREALLDDVEQQAREEIVPAALEQGNDLLEAYGNRHDYNVQAIVDAAQWEVDRTASGVTITLRWPDPALLFERGTVDHVVEARNADVLSFIWAERHDPPQWVREEFDREGDGYRVFLPKVEVTGLPEARFIRDTLNALRRRLDT